MNQGDWTRELFLDHAELYLPFLERARERAPDEVDILLDRFATYGVPPSGRVLDVSCGIGRHSVPLAQRGYEVVGLDLSPLFISRATELAEEAGVAPRFIQGDLRDMGSILGTEEPFDAAINMFTSLGYYGREEDVALLESIRNLVTSSGLLMVETMNRDFLVRHFRPVGVEEAGNIKIVSYSQLDFETSRTDNAWEFYEGHNDDLKHRLRLEFQVRVYSLHELKGLFEEGGWQYLAGYARAQGEARLVPLTADLNRMWVMGRNSRH